MAELDNNLPIKVEEFTKILKTAPDTLSRNEKSVINCENAGKDFLDTIEACGGIQSDELDAKVAGFIDKVKVTVKNMNERRSPITQLLTQVAKRFTVLESQIDLKTAGSIANKLQAERNKYAAKKLEEQKKAAEEARRKQQIVAEMASYKSELEILLDRVYTAYVEKHIAAIQGFFDRLTLENFAENSKHITTANTTFVWSDYVTNVTDNIATYFITAEQRNAIKLEVAAAKKQGYPQVYSFELQELKEYLIDRLPSKKKELEEIAELKRTNEAEAARAEKERLEREAQAKKEAEEKRANEAREKEQANSIAKTASEVQAAFDFAAASMPDTQVKAKVSKKIQVTNPKGYMMLYQMWFTGEGISMTNEELEKAHKKFISYCEKQANKDGGELIQSPFVKYVDDVKAK